jgi:AraC-like DNA-binding protein
MGKIEKNYHIDAHSLKKLESDIQKFRDSYMELVYERRGNRSDTASWRNNEMEYARIIAMGAVNAAQAMLDDIEKNGITLTIGTMSSDLVQQSKFFLVSTNTIYCRIAIDNGLPSGIAYSISDAFLQYTDSENDPEKIYLAAFQSIYEYTRAVNEWQRRNCSDKIRLCLDYIITNLHYHISLKDLSSLTGMSCNYLSDLFYKETGIRPLDYIRSVKLQYAAHMLTETGKTISEISELLAFLSPSSFGAYFRKQYGLSPTKYRNQKVTVRGSGTREL